MVSIVHAARDIGRIREISAVLARHGFGEIVRRMGFGGARKAVEHVATDADMSTAVRIRCVLEELGPSFVKLGQIVSTRADILPPDVIAELTKLQDSVPPVPYADIREQVERALGAGVDELFAGFDQEPLAAASIAQVHRAQLRTSEGIAEVVVKVQRPGIGETVASDLDLLHTFAALLERAVPETRTFSPTGLVQQFDRAITSELDFTLEAENAERFAKNFADFRNVKFPRVYHEASSKHVLTLEFLDGEKIYEAIEHGHSPRLLTRLAMDILVKQVFEDGFFHADPHPGNVLVLGTPDDPRYAMLDLGMVGRLSPRMRDLAVDLMISAGRRDYDGIADALYAIGTPREKIDMNVYRAEVAMKAERYLGKQLKDIDLSALMRDLVQSAKKFGIEMPMDFVLVGKAIMTIDGVAKEVYPELDIFEEAKPLFVDILKKRYSPERLGNELLKRLEKLSGTTYNMPEQIGEVLDELRYGRLTVRTTDPEAIGSADRLGRRVSGAIVAASLLLSGAWILSSGYEAVGGGLIGTALLLLVVSAARDAYQSFNRR